MVEGGVCIRRGLGDAWLWCVWMFFIGEVDVGASV